MESEVECSDQLGEDGYGEVRYLATRVLFFGNSLTKKKWKKTAVTVTDLVLTKYLDLNRIHWKTPKFGPFKFEHCVNGDGHFYG